MSKKKKMVPQLRFPGYSGEWEEKKLKDISIKVTEKNKDRVVTETLTNSAEFGIISQNDFFDKEISNEKNIDGYYVVKANDFVYNPRISNFAPVGPIKRNKLNKTGIMSPLYYIFRTQNIDLCYLEKYFDTSYWHRFMKLNGDSGARADRLAIKDEIFKQMPIPYPNKIEQQKIGSFFTQLDDLIALHQQKLTHLQERKKGLLQKMFPKAGEKVPELRFPGFSGDWVEKKLGEVLDLLKDGTHGTHKDVDKGIYLLSAKNIKNGQINIDETDRKISEQEYKTIHKNFSLKKGDVLLTIVGSIGESAILNSTECITFQRSVAYLRPNKEISSIFLYTLINSKNFQRELDRKKVLSAQPGIYLGDLSTILVQLPNDKEQKKIGAFFKQIDDSIVLQQQKLNYLKDRKKALLQQMFV